MFRTTSILALAVTVASLGLAAFSSTAHAQYPPASTASVTVAASTTVTGTGETVAIGTVVTDPTGDRLPGVLCSFAITSQPGSDAKLTNTGATTNENGVATTQLAVGSTAGNIVVSSTCNGTTGQTTVVAGASVAPAPQPQPAGGTVALPSAGMGTGTEGANGVSAVALLLLATLLTTGAGAFVMARRS